MVPLSGASTGLLTRFAYTANHDSGTVSIFTADLGSGRLRADGYVVAGTNPMAVAVAPSNKFAYVVNYGDNTIAGYSNQCEKRPVNSRSPGRPRPRATSPPPSP